MKKIISLSILALCVSCTAGTSDSDSGSVLSDSGSMMVSDSGSMMVTDSGSEMDMDADSMSASMACFDALHADNMAACIATDAHLRDLNENCGVNEEYFPLGCDDYFATVEEDCRPQLEWFGEATCVDNNISYPFEESPACLPHDC